VEGKQKQKSHVFKFICGIFLFFDVHYPSEQTEMKLVVLEEVVGLRIDNTGCLSGTRW